jgi:ATP-dependent Clp protease protease subunit
MENEVMYQPHYWGMPRNTLVPMVIERTSQGERSFDIFSRLHKERIVMLQGEVEDGMASVIKAQLLQLEAEDPGRDIYLYIDSPGGSVLAGLGIYDTMNLIGCDVVTICTGLAASMGAFLLNGGTKGKRYATPSSRIMIHAVSSGTGGTVHDQNIQMAESNYLNDYLMREMAKNSGKTFEELFEDCKRDKYMSTQESIDYGLIDGFVQSKKQK